MDLRRWREVLDDQCCVLLITHKLGGGVKRFGEERCIELGRAGVRALILAPPDRNVSPPATFTCELQDAKHELPPLGFNLPDDVDLLYDCLNPLALQSVEIHHLLGHHASVRARFQPDGIIWSKVRALETYDLSYNLPALLSEDGVPPTRCELVGGGRGRVGIMLAVMGRARV